nr:MULTISPECIES: hypothetical protein [unclassified Bacillus (in: firmicutes)]
MKKNTLRLYVYILLIVSFVILTGCTRNEQIEDEPANVQQSVEKGVIEGYVMVKNKKVISS